ncbi:MAG: molybdopterin binding oxidoreductase [Chloroflexi bacterium OLB15]|nr:MAG: molybdopterin binding oxidoreductase [Chloroflexi bacterium OLB15]
MSLINNQLARRKLEDQVRKEGRLPPGQSLTLDFPVLHYGGIPQFNPETWDMRVFGLVDQEMRWNWQEFQALPAVKIATDIHCVTRWSKFDTEWEGILFRDFVKLFGVKPEAKYVIAHCDGDYTTNTPLNIMYDDDVLLAYKFNGQYLAPEHGFPVRTLVPKRYFWKSAKWLRALEFSPVDKPGFWEQAGYHNEGDPWREERMQRRGFFW